ncbi:hypothetical protein AAWM_07459 [Aspergillus awamori]|uniref:Uncharacterized protein n=1 Tax=Aspergillus awamori TaxID=105351 RepID=A0A401KZ88_ASPAW|nr:hypothetical protein AAWM_07459 [Aspergillus awamori]
MRTFSVAVTSLLAVTGLVAAIPAPQGPVDLTNPPSGHTINPLATGLDQGVSGAPAVAQQPADQPGDAGEEAANALYGVGSSGQDSNPAASQNTTPQPSQLENNGGLVGNLASLVG